MSRASDIEGLEKDCASAHTERVKAIRRITRETKAFVGDSKMERETMASALHKKIDTEEATRKRQAKADADVRVAADKKLKADTRKMVAGFKAESDAASKAWGSLVKTMAEKRQGAVKKPAAPVVKKTAAKKAPAAPMGNQAKILAVVKANPSGVRLVEIESKTGIARIVAARVLKGLVDGGRINKDELLYKLS